MDRPSLWDRQTDIATAANTTL